MKKLLPSALFGLLLLSACGGGGSGTTGSSTPQTPSGSGLLSVSYVGASQPFSSSQAHPTNQSILSPFALAVSEPGYTGDFTASVPAGQCFQLGSAATAVTAFDIAPSGQLCVGGFNGPIDTVTFSDSAGNSTTAYFQLI